MRRTPPWLLSFFWAGALLVSRADAQTAKPAFTYGATPGCPGQAAFLASVEARTHASSLEGPSAGLRISVTLRDTPRGAAGKVTLVDPEGAVLEREVTGSSCTEVADVLSFVVALAIDPEASLSPHLVEPREVEPAPAAPPPATSAPAPASSLRAMVSPPSSARSELPGSAPIAPEPFPTPLPADRHWEWAFGALVDGSLGKTPNLLLGPGIFARLSPKRGRWFDPSFFAAFERAIIGSATSSSAGEVRFSGTFARLDGCLSGLRADWFLLSPCIEVEAGALEASSSLVSNPRSSPWFALGPVLDLRANLGSLFFLASRLALRAPTTLHRFYFRPDTTVYEVKDPGVGFDVGLGVVLP